MKLNRVVANVVINRRHKTTRKVRMVIAGLCPNGVLQAAGRRLAAEGQTHEGLRISKSWEV